MYFGKKTTTRTKTQIFSPTHAPIHFSVTAYCSPSPEPSSALQDCPQQRVNQNIPNINTKCNIITIIIVVVVVVFHICQRRRGGARNRQLAGQLHSEPLEASKRCADQARNRYWHKAEQRASGIWLWRTTCYSKNRCS